MMNVEGKTIYNQTLPVGSKINAENVNEILLQEHKMMFLVDSQFKISGYNQLIFDAVKSINNKELKKGDDVFEHLHKSVKAEILKGLSSAFEGRSYSSYFSMPIDEAEHLLVFKITPLEQNGVVKNVLLEFINVNGQEYFNQQIVEKGHFIEKVFDTVKAGIKITDLSGDIIRVNEAYAEIIGQDKEALKGKNVIGFLHPDEAEEGAKQFGDFISLDKVPAKRWILKKGETYIHTDITFSKATMDGKEVVIFFTVDVTEEVALKRQLEEKKRENESLLNNISIMLWSVDKDLNFITANKAACKYFEKLYGYQFKAGDNSLNIYPGELKELKKSRRQSYLQVLSNGAPIPFSILDDNREKLYHFSGEMYPTVIDGEVCGVNCFMQLDTELFLRNRFSSILKNFKIAASRATETEELYWLLTEEILGKIYIDEGGILISGQDHLHAVTYYLKGNTTGRKLLKPFSIPKKEGVVGYVAQSGKAQVVSDSEHDSRTYLLNQSFKSEIAVPVIVDGEVLAVINCESRHKDFFDVPIYLEILTEAAKELGEQIVKLWAANKLREVEEVNRAVLDSTNDSFLLLDRNGVILTYNRRAQNRLSGYFGKALIKGASLYDYLPQRYHQNFSDHLHKAFSGFLRREDYQLEHNGKLLWINGTYSAAFNSDGELFGANLVLKNVTFEREAERQLKEQNLELEKSNKELDKFVYSVSHDLRAPLSSILGLNYLVDLSDDLTEIKEFNTMMRDAGLRLDEFIRSILNYSRNSRLAISYQQFNVTTVVNEIVNDLKYMKGSENVKIIRDIRRERIYHDEDRIRVILNSLISNSIKYYNTEAEDPFVKISIYENNNELVIKVSDNGEGIDEKHLPNLFDMFFTASLRAKGSGIGLYILKDAVKMLKGTVEVQSRLAEGTEFIINLPKISSGQ